MTHRHLALPGFFALAVLAMILSLGPRTEATTTTWLNDLGLDAEGLPAPDVLSESSEELLVAYGTSVAFEELVGQWTIALFDAGYEKLDDYSESYERIVIAYQQGGQSWVLVMPAADAGPRIALSRTEDPAKHWAVSSSASPPEALADVW